MKLHEPSDTNGTIQKWKMNTLKWSSKAESGRNNSIKLIMGSETHQKIHFFHQWESVGSIQDHWDTNNPPKPRDPAAVGWMLRQVTGISSGLDCLAQHHSYGALQPENLQCFSKNDDDIVLKIADFGMLRHMSHGNNQTSNEADTARAALRYTPPELAQLGLTELDMERVLVRTDADTVPTPFIGSLSRKYDVWSLGCLLIEFLTWVQWGQTGLRTFHIAVRQHQVQGEFWDRSGTRFRVNTAVLQQIQLLRDQDCLCDLLDLVRHRMLIPVHRRASIDEVLTVLDAVCSKTGAYGIIAPKFMPLPPGVALFWQLQQVRETATRAASKMGPQIGGCYAAI